MSIRMTTNCVDRKSACLHHVSLPALNGMFKQAGVLQFKAGSDTLLFAP